MYCKCMRLQKIQGSDMKLGGYLSILTNLTTSDDDPPSSNTGESAKTPKNSTVPNQKTPKKASERVLFCVKTTQNTDTEEKQKKPM